MVNLTYAKISEIVESFEDRLNPNKNTRPTVENMNLALGLSGFNEKSVGFSTKKDFEERVYDRFELFKQRNNGLGIFCFGRVGRATPFISAGYLTNPDKRLDELPGIVRMMHELFPLAGLDIPEEHIIGRREYSGAMSSIIGKSLHNGDKAMALFYQGMRKDLPVILHYRKMQKI